MFKKVNTALLGLAISMGLMPVQAAETKKVDVLLVGGGIMSATLAVWLNELEPSWSMEMVERLDGVAEESSNGWNNAGTGHSALAELNYTPEDKNGNVDISKAIEINEAFQISRQFWSWQVKTGVLKNPRSFINSTPHMSFVWGDNNIQFLRKRYAALQASPLFSGMQYSEEHEQIKKWVPLMMEGRDPAQKLAVTWSPIGTDVNFGEITRQFVANLKAKQNFNLQLSSEVEDINHNDDGTWRVKYKNLKDGTVTETDTKFLFIGAGGAALHLLQESGIPEAKEYGGFPVGGSWLVTDNQTLAMQHMGKAYGIASTGAPPMSVPHLDTRVLDGKRVILFGPFATFSTKFLKNGSYFDLLTSTTTHNVWPMTRVGIEQYPLIEYLAGQVMMSDDDRFAALQQYFPNAKKEDWRLMQAGQRVQIIKRDEEKGGVLKLGTEIVASKDGSIAGLLGASPGASTAAPIMLGVLEKVFKDKVATPEWQAKLRQIVPSYGTKLNNNPDRVAEEWAYTAEVLQLTPPPPVNKTGNAPTPAPAAQPAKSNPASDMAL
ncbi:MULTISPECIES: malate dehydrogenase (quinone) [Pseudomonas syringae group genomosp. 2]|uniref:malate dehydrogenase (quinone) n=1 Tax=Pseudomonas syringae group genomosp. 2 TaxID=251698 RepID=UPI0001CC10F7|nr:MULTISPECIES: malate dehydrogenase (quinone) [Pseudomonas syringae group genomosp. 2]EGH03359.1 malate:quinone oxidoreductase [Pseudomonas amygdali pv. aesculi str. 0893_23]KWT12910.1 malate:quinone oxidoreductase [Pseudomonas amygdali pv. aesculi]KWT24385.1 malate:quinone oxidoreductase [Pseudomonas amygdali pv. aesculi]KWT27794.1 malate:quinone oxidoreductase [Pseudomonas amygdali pv. aesculi]KWT30336.1 malate:quinone oxidoreductase [Pseudomonas amygdali pv. aesculi]